MDGLNLRRSKRLSKRNGNVSGNTRSSTKRVDSTVVPPPPAKRVRAKPSPDIRKIKCENWVKAEEKVYKNERNNNDNNKAPDVHSSFPGGSTDPLEMDDYRDCAYINFFGQISEEIQKAVPDFKPVGSMKRLQRVIEMVYLDDDDEDDFEVSLNDLDCLSLRPYSNSVKREAAEIARIKQPDESFKQETEIVEIKPSGYCYRPPTTSWSVSGKIQSLQDSIKHILPDTVNSNNSSILKHSKLKQKRVVHLPSGFSVKKMFKCNSNNSSYFEIKPVTQLKVEVL